MKSFLLLLIIALLATACGGGGGGGVEVKDQNRFSDSSDGGASDDIVEDNEPPELTGLSNQSTFANTVMAALDFSITDTDGDTVSCTTSIQTWSDDQSLVDNDNIVLSGTAPDCNVTITPENGVTGSTTISLKASDEKESATFTFTLDINSTGPYKLAFLSQPQNVDINTGMSSDVTIQIQDSLGDLQTSATDNVTIAIYDDPAGGSNITSTLTVAAVSGVATFSGVTLDSAGSGFTILATATSLLSDTSSGFTVNDVTPPVDNIANLQFTNPTDNDGNDVAVTWTAFSDDYLTDHRLYSYSDSGCTTDEIDHGLTGSSSNSNSSIMDGLPAGVRYAKVSAIDISNNTTTSACSTDSITITIPDATPPTDNTANLQFSDSTDIDGNLIAVEWTAFSDTNLYNHRLKTYTNSSCTTGEIDHGVTGSSESNDSSIINGLTSGNYYGTVTAIDLAGNETTSACSTDFITINLVDTTPPTDNTANLQFLDVTDTDGNDLSISWTAFTDINLTDHRIRTFTNSSCTVGETDHGLTGSSTNTNFTIVDGLAEGTYYANVTAYDFAGNETTSACSTDSIVISIAPVDNGANLQFTDVIENDGNDVAVTWSAFTDTNLTDHRLKTYTNSSCTVGEVDHGLTGSSGASDSAIIDGLDDGQYFARVTAIDADTNSTESGCSSDSITVAILPVDNGANLQFTDTVDGDGEDLAITWTAFTDTNLSDHRIKTYTNNTCSAGEVDHGLTGSAGASDSAIVDGLGDGTYYAKVTAYDSFGNATESACSTDSVTVTSAPIDNTANLQFLDEIDTDGIDLTVTWTAFTDSNLTDHRLKTYTNNTCTVGEVDHGLTGSATNSDNVIIDGLDDGIYYANVTAIDADTNETVSACSTDSITVAILPVDNGANLQFTDVTETDGDDVAITWTAFTDTNLSDHRIKTYTNNTCTVGEIDHGLTGSSSASDSTIVDGLSDGVSYYANVTAYDSFGNATTSGCSTDSVTVSIGPIDNTANLQFLDEIDADGIDLTVTWTAFTDANLSDHRLKTYTNNTCTVGEVDHGLTGSVTNSDNIIIDALDDGVYYANVTAIDADTNETVSACSTDSITVAILPVDNGANLQFTDASDSDGDDVAITWTAFTDTNLSDHRIKTYTNSGCSVGEVDHGLTGSSGASDSTIVDGLVDGTYYAKVTAYDSFGNATESACSTDSIVVSLAPIDNAANLQFLDVIDVDGNDLSVTWTAFSDTNLTDHRLKTFTNNSCSAGEVDHGVTGTTATTNNSIIDGLDDGVYFANVTAIDADTNETVSACSTDSITVAINPTDNGANLQFTNTINNGGDNVAVTWTAFSDTNLSDHRLRTYTNSGCSVGETDHGLTGSSTASNNTIIDGLTPGTYYANVTAYDSFGNETTSACSTDSIVVTNSPIDNTADLQFLDVIDVDGNDLSVTWTAFTDTNLTDHRLKTYTNNICTLGEVDHGLTGSATNSDNAIIDGLDDGVYFAKVTAIDADTNSTESACSTDSITVAINPTDNGANLQFTDATDTNGDDIAITWTAFSDTNLSDHRIKTYTNSGCSVGEIDHGLTGSSVASDSTIVDGLTDGTYYAKVTAYDSFGNATESACSTDSIVISLAPVDNVANLQFTNEIDLDGNDLAVTWTAFTDTNLTDHRLKTFTNASCSAGEVDHGLTSSTTNSNSSIIDGLDDGIYFANVTAIDADTNETVSACSSDSITVAILPVDNGANLQFTDSLTTDGDNVAVTWTAFSDTNLSDHRLRTYTDSGCSIGEDDHGLTGSATAANNTIIDGLAPGTYYANVTAYDLYGNATTSACSTDTITIAQAGPAQLVITTEPTSAAANVAISPSIIIEVRDAANDVVTDATNTVTLAFGTDPSAGSATLSGTVAVNAVAGIATFDDINIDEINSGYTLVASSGSLTGTTSASFNIVAGAPSMLQVGTQPSNTEINVGVSPVITINILDAFGNQTNASDSVTLAISNDPSGGATLSGTLTVAAVAGVASFPGVNINTPSSGYTLVATSGVLTSTITSSFDIFERPTVTITSAPDISMANVTSYSVVGTCSENGRTVNVAVGTLNFTPICNSGSWTTGNQDVSSLSDDPSLSVTADHDNASSVTAVQAATTVDKDTSNHIVAITQALTIDASNHTGYTVSGTCSLNSAVVNVAIGSLLFNPICSSGTWTTGMVDVSSLSDGPSIAISADHSTAPQDSVNVLKDTASATVTISSAPDINSSNETNYACSGTCSEDGVDVSVSIGTLSFTPSCSSGSWTTGFVDVSSLSDTGAMIINVVHSTANANTIISKNTSTPSVANLSVASTLKDSATLNWNLVDPGGFTINDYIINYRVKGTSTWLSFDDGESTTIGATVDSLTASTFYEFRAAVLYNTTTQSAWSNVAEGETKPDDPIFDSPYKAMNVGGATTSNVVALEDSTTVTLNGTILVSLDKGEVHNFTSAQFDVIDADKPIYTGGRRGSGGNTSKGNMVWSPASWAGKQFSFNATRTNAQRLQIYAIEDTYVEVKNGGTVLASISLSATVGGSVSWSVYGSYQVIATGTILAFHYSEGGGGTNIVDPKPILPSSTEIIGFPSNSMRLTTFVDGTNWNTIHSDSTTQNGSLSKTGVQQINPTGGTTSLYQSNSLLISADQNISGASYADSNGNCAAAFLPTNLMKKRYAVNVSSDYVAFASKEAGTIEVRDSSDTLITTLTLTRSGANTNAPYKARIGTTAAGVRFISTVPVAAWYQPDNDTGAADQDETILYGND